ncbi:MAG TPA: hypothetical protein VN025_04050 [Candidatus Dormibacteraeota bacterium]|jgi:hypothetical protein|nr:hypothetical protein [Candidatus Dormibacteraeota bacterium]
MIRSKMAMGFLWVVLALMFHAWPMVPVAKGQGTRKDDIVFNSRGVPLAGATVRVCAMPASGQPCVPLALIYSDPGLTQALANPTTTDGLGNYSFYAAPGKYEVEISGPGITTKQIPNVLLPSDPSSPTFTGAISAFSLNLTGNLTVNGSTTVIGNLASGSLTLSNQSSPPGTASSGTVNLYSKTDKRLYYKDDTGAEIGPIANTSGAQTNITNTFTASQNFDADVHSKGPNPYFDIMRYGGYAAALPAPSTTGSITSGGTTLALGAAQDFANGQGIVVYKAGSLPTIPTPPAPASVTPIGLTGGSTTYTYQWVAEDYFGGLTAAGSSGSTTTGQSSLGLKTIALTSLSRASGLDTYTCAANCNLTANSLVQISGFAGGTNVTTNGTVVVNTTPTGTTFTVFATGYADYGETASATASVLACNMLTPSGALTQESKILRYWVYRNGTLAGVVPGQDPFYIDCGQGVSGQPSYVPTSAPGSSQPGYLVTTIVSGGGTASLMLANAAGTTASSQTVLHDNSSALKAAWAAAYASHGGIVSIPIIPGGGFQSFPFEATTDLTTIPNPTASGVKLLIAIMTLNQPLILPNFSSFEGVPQISGTSFDYVVPGAISGTATPQFMANAATRGAIRLSNLKFFTASNGQVSFLSDETLGAGGQVGFVFDDVGFSGTNASAAIIKGGFDFWFTRGVCNVGGSENGQWYAHPCLNFTNNSTFLNTSGSQMPGRIYFDRTNFSGGTAIQIDNLPTTGQAGSFSTGGGNVFINGILHETNSGPTLRMFFQNGAFGYGLTINDLVMADATNGAHQALVEMTGTTNFTIATIKDSKGFLFNPTILGGGSTLQAICMNNIFVSAACGQSPDISFYGPVTKYDGGVLTAVNGGRLTYGMATPLPPSVGVSSGGGAPVGTIPYAITAVDADGKETIVSTTVNAVTSSGTQTVTVTPPALPAGAVGWFPYRSGVKAAVNGGGGNCPFALAPGTPFVDTFGFTCATPPPTSTVAGSSYMSSSGLGTQQIKINNEPVSASPRAEQNVFLPGLLTSTWTGATWTLDKALTITRVQVQAKTAPSGCTTNAVVRLTDGTTPVNLTISAAANDSGAIAQNYAAGASITLSLQTAAAGCTTSPADANVVVQYKMQ